IAVVIALLFLVLSGGCGKTGVDPVEDATDIDAIINIIRYDKAALFTADKLEMPAPDTSALIGALPYELVSYWRTVNSDSFFIKLGDQDTVLEDSVRLVPFRLVSIEQFFTGNMEIIALDTTDGDSRRVRLSKPYTTKATVSGMVKKYGFDYNSRRGWALTEIGNAFYGSVLGQVRLWTSSHPEDTVLVGLRTYPFSEFPVFADGESLTVSVTPTELMGAAAIKCPTADGFLWRPLTKTESGAFVGGFRLYNNIYDKHIIVDMVRSRVFEQDTTRYFTSAIGVSYNVRQ
ncbi:MAG TPA: hypothetical protein DEO84_11005, partial [candidate division Zixibacteria bacterium]|nr:hypothetical protein [candidate division Zixibacteria bacterium]